MQSVGGAASPTIPLHSPMSWRPIFQEQKVQLQQNRNTLRGTGGEPGVTEGHRIFQKVKREMLAPHFSCLLSWSLSNFFQFPLSLDACLIHSLSVLSTQRSQSSNLCNLTGRKPCRYSLEMWLRK